MKREEITKRKKKKTILKPIGLWLYTFLLTFLIIAFVYSLKDLGMKEIVSLRNFWLINGVVDGILLITFLFIYKVDATSIALKENDLEDSSWLSTKKLKKLKEFTVCDYKDLKEKEDGIVIGAEKKGKSVEVISTSQLHALIVGTTGSGKTTGFVDQNIEALANSKTKPSLVITDPKKELFEKHSKQLESLGYKISVLDLREPYTSARWNPLSVLSRRIALVKDLEYNLKNEEGKYYAAGETFLSYRDAKTRKQELLDEIYENAKDLVYTLCPVENKDQPTWENGARNLILGLVLALCEDTIAGKVDEKQLTLFNVYHNITKYCQEDTTVLKKYLLEDRNEFSKVRSLVNTVLITSDRTLTSYLSEVNAYMQQLTDEGILSLTSENDLDIVSMDEEANAVFVIIPDERVTRHRFVTLFVTQLYKELVEKANINQRKGDTKTAILKRNTYFILDEFGNLPKFENMDGLVTVSRSRGIRFLFILQSFSQLTAKYGKEVGDVIKTNCNVKLFIGSDDPETRREFSELCGQKKVKSFSVNSGDDRLASSSTGAQNQPLITCGMLERLNGDEKGDAIVSVRGYEAIWTKFTPSYLLEKVYFPSGKADMSKKEAKVFDKEEALYDITGYSSKEEDKEVLKEIEKQEELEDSGEMVIESNVEPLDNKWDEVVERINELVDEICLVVNEVDARILRSAKTHDKCLVIYEIMRHYNATTRLKISQIAKQIEEEEIPKLLELREMAVKGG